MASVIAFDVNETLLDLRALDPVFEDLLGSAAYRSQWFAQMLQLSFVGGLTGNYVDYSTAQHAALLMLAASLDRPISDDQARQVVRRMETLPPHLEAPDALRRLRRTDLTIVALTNSPMAVAEAQLTNAGIRENFHRIISADQVRQLKPAAAPYLAVAAEYGVPPGGVRLVAAHSWDVEGALAAGCQAAFVARPGIALSPLVPPPEIIGPDIRTVIDRIMVVDSA